MNLYNEVSNAGGRMIHENWTTEMRLVAYILAWDADDETRESRISQEDLMNQSGLTESGVKRALVRLAEDGHEFRVPVGEDKDGNPTYTYPGKAMTYKIPPQMG